MVVMTERPKWSDERLDDLSQRVDQGFGLLDRRIDRIEERIEAGFARMNERFDQQAARMDRFQQTLILFSGGLIAALIAALTTLVVSVVA